MTLEVNGRPEQLYQEMWNLRKTMETYVAG